MEKIDQIVFGDNQFFGINHRSQEKAEEMLKRFGNIDNIFEVYDNAFDCGVKAVMLNSNEKAQAICDRFRANKSKYGDLTWYPSIPYPYKYANMVNELGIFPAISEVLFKGNSTGGVLSMIGKGAAAVFTKDAMRMMEMLIDVEYKMFRDLNVKCLFLQNVIADLILGYDIKEVFEHYCSDKVLIYATSNRRHLIRETWGDRRDMEYNEDVHRSDTMEEKLSLVGLGYVGMPIAVEFAKRGVWRFFKGTY